MTSSTDAPGAEAHDDESHTGLAALSTWGRVYGAVMVVFAGMVLAMWVFARFYA